MPTSHSICHAIGYVISMLLKQNLCLDNPKKSLRLKITLKTRKTQQLYLETTRANVLLKFQFLLHSDANCQEKN